MDRFSQVFQKSYESTTSILYIEANRLVKVYAANVLITASILAANENLKDLKFDDHLEDESFGIGSDTWASVPAMEREYGPKPFFRQ